MPTEDEENCMICLDKMSELRANKVEVVELDDCGHKICEPCYFNNEFEYCPVCRKPLRIETKSIYFEKKWYTFLHSKGKILTKTSIERDKKNNDEIFTDYTCGITNFERELQKNGFEKQCYYYYEKERKEFLEYYKNYEIVKVPNTPISVVVKDGNMVYDIDENFIYDDSEVLFTSKIHEDMSIQKTTTLEDQLKNALIDFIKNLERKKLFNDSNEELKRAFEEYKNGAEFEKASESVFEILSNAVKKIKK